MKCKKCKYREVHNTVFEGFSEPVKIVSSLCMHEKSTYWCPISEDYIVMSTMIMRETGRPCGPDAVLWEKKDEVKKM